MEFIQKDSVDILKIKDEITIKNADEFKRSMENFLADSKDNLVLDLEEVSYLNSSALGVIAQTAMNAKKQDKELVVSGVKPPINEIFEVVKFGAFMKLFSSQEEAEAYYLA